MSVSLLPSSLRNLLADLERLPGIGPKSAQRIAFYLLRQSPESVARFASGLAALHAGIRHCVTCGMLSERETCQVCADARRDARLLCVVESPLDVVAIERTGEFRGRYHVLGGLLSPLDRVGPDDLNLKTLTKRVRAEAPGEVILALNPSVEGEVTSLYIRKLLAAAPVIVSRLAQGLPTGAALEYADDLTIVRALSGRRILDEPERASAHALPRAQGS